jgi:polyhydroxybutyrate depolymerase
MTVRHDRGLQPGRAVSRLAGLAAAVAVVLGIAGFAVLHSLTGSGQPAQASTAQAGPAQAGAAQASTGPTAVAQAARAAASTRTGAMTVAGLKRSYEVIAPAGGLPGSAPIIVMLAGIKATTAGEIGRDKLVPYAQAGRAEIVYPAGYGESWNAGGCCGSAAARNVNDLAFLKALVATVDPGRRHGIYVIGYSNGARMAYRVACDDPGLFDGYAVVKGLPTAGCTMRRPVKLIQMDSVNDPEVSYKAVTALMSRLHAAEKCPARATVTRSGSMTQTTWYGCGGRTVRLALASWSGGVHSFPRPPGSNPGAAAVLWAFVTKRPIAPIP